MLNQSLRTRLRVPVAATLATVTLLAVGCGGDAQKGAQNNDKAGPSYADLLVTYNAEMTALDRLEQKKETLLQKIAAVGQPTSEDAIKLLDKVLTSGLASSGDEGSIAAADPNDALDQAVERAQKAQDITRDLLESLGKRSTNTPEQTAQNEQIQNEWSRELEALEKEIATQQQRVERARQARDAAETAAQ